MCGAAAPRYSPPSKRIRTLSPLIHKHVKGIVCFTGRGVSHILTDLELLLTTGWRVCYNPRGKRGSVRVSNLFVVAGPSGVGKSTLIHRLLKRYPNRIVHPLTHTTRSIRPGEVDGRDMIFVSHASFTPRLLDNEFLATTEYQGQFYGTLRSDVSDALRDGKKVIVAFDENGVDCLINQGCPAIFVYLAAPGPTELAKWLEIRWPQKGPEYERRLKQAETEWRNFECNPEFRRKFDHWILSDDMSAMEARMSTIMGF